MSHDFSFSTKALIALLTCLAGLLAVTFFAGFAVARLHSLPSESKAAQAKIPRTVAGEASRPLDNSHSPAKSVVSEPTLAEQPRRDEPVGRGVRHYCLQFGSYQDKTVADQRVKDLAAKQITANEETRQDQYQQSWFVVRTGSYDTLEEASVAAEGVRSRLNQPVLVRPVDSL